jgi:hypothetical protein
MHEDKEVVYEENDDIEYSETLEIDIEGLTSFSCQSCLCKSKAREELMFMLGESIRTEDIFQQQDEYLIGPFFAGVVNSLM